MGWWWVGLIPVEPENFADLHIYWLAGCVEGVGKVFERERGVIFVNLSTSDVGDCEGILS